MHSAILPVLYHPLNLITFRPSPVTMICNSGLLLTRKLKELMVGSADSQPVKKPPPYPLLPHTRPATKLTSSQSTPAIEPLLPASSAAQRHILPRHLQPQPTKQHSRNQSYNTTKDLFEIDKYDSYKRYKDLINCELSKDINDTEYNSITAVNNESFKNSKTTQNGKMCKKRERIHRSKSSNNLGSFVGRLASYENTSNLHMPRAGNGEISNNPVEDYKNVNGVLASSRNNVKKIARQLEKSACDPSVLAQITKQKILSASGDNLHAKQETEVSLQSGGAISTKISRRSPSFAESKKLALCSSSVVVSDHSKAYGRAQQFRKSKPDKINSNSILISEKKYLSSPDLFQECTRKKKKPRDPKLAPFVGLNSCNTPIHDYNSVLHGNIVNKDIIRIKQEEGGMGQCSSLSNANKVENVKNVRNIPVKKTFSLDRRWKSHRSHSPNLTELEGKVPVDAHKIISNLSPIPHGKKDIKTSIASHKENDQHLYQNCAPQESKQTHTGTFPKLKSKIGLKKHQALNNTGVTSTSRDCRGKSFSSEVPRRFAQIATSNLVNDNNYSKPSVFLHKLPQSENNHHTAQLSNDSPGYLNTSVHNNASGCEHVSSINSSFLSPRLLQPVSLNQRQNVIETTNSTDESKSCAHPS